MKGLVITLLGTLMFFSNCATKRKTKEVERVEVVNENQVKNDSSADIKIERLSHDYLSNYSSNESLLSKLGLVFNGKTNEDKGSFSIKETEQGLQMDISGALQMALDKTHSKDETFTKAEAIKLFDSIIKANLQQNKTERSEQLLDSFKSDTQKEKTDISFWIYVVIGSVLVVGIAIYVAIKQLKGGK